MPKVYAPDDEKAALNIALSRLTARMRTRMQLRLALARKGFNESTIEKVLDKLADMGLMDDAQYAARMVELQRERGGRRRVEQKLWAHGVESETAKEALLLISDEDECERAAALAKEWLSVMVELPLRQRKQRVFARLMRRGFLPETISSALRKLDMEMDENDE